MLNICWTTMSTVDSVKSSYQHTLNLFKASPILAVMSCSIPVCLFLYFSLHLSKFVHLIRHHLFINHLWGDAVIPVRDFLKEVLALSRFLSLHLQLHSSRIQMSIHMPHTHQTTPPLVCVDVQPSANPSAEFMLSSTSNHCPSLHSRCSIQLDVFTPKVLWFHWRFCLTSVSVTLGRCFAASQTVNCYYSHLKTSNSH